MSTTLKEWLQQTIAELEEVRDAVPGVVNEDAANALAAMKLALASLEAEPVAWRYRHHNGLAPSNWRFVDSEGECNMAPNYQRQALYITLPAPVSVPESAPVAYIFKHPAGRLFWSLTDESNKGQSDVMPVYSAPVQAFVPPAIEPDYEVIKGILPTANPDEYACCIAADMWNACRAAMLNQEKGNG